MPLKGIELVASGGGGGGPTTSPWSVVLTNGNTTTNDGAHNPTIGANDAIIWNATGGTFSALAGTYLGNRTLAIQSVSASSGGVTIDLFGNVTPRYSAELLTTATGPFWSLTTVNGVPTGAASGSYFVGSAPVVIDRNAGALYAYYGGTWNALSSGGAGSLQGAYNGGATIAEAGGVAVAISSTTADNGSVLTVTKNPAGAQSGTVFSVTAGANTTGDALAILNSGIGHAISATTNSAGSTPTIQLTQASTASSGLSINMGASSAGPGVLVTHAGSGVGIQLTQGTGGGIAITGGTHTTSAPVFDASETFNSGGVTFEAFKINITNTASAAASTLFTLQLAATPQMLVNVAGDVVLHAQGSENATGANTPWPFLATCNGAPSGTPTSFTGAAAVALDRAAGKLWAYYGSAWNPIGFPLAVTPNTGNATAVANTANTNAGAGGTVVLTLPAGPPVGTVIQFSVTDAHELEILAPASVSIYFGATSSGAAGFWEATDVGSSATLVYAKTNTWVAQSVTGNWTPNA
jgi:hypothetical protein